jgi:hypothetical protein
VSSWRSDWLVRVPVTLGREHFEQLSASVAKLYQRTYLFIRRGAWHRLHGPDKSRQHYGIKHVGFRQPTSGMSKIQHLA